jgi:hypothetical protein
VWFNVDVFDVELGEGLPVGCRLGCCVFPSPRFAVQIDVENEVVNISVYVV